METILVTGDWHEGAETSAPHPDFRQGPGYKFHGQQTRLWEGFRHVLAEIAADCLMEGWKPPSVLICTGDMIDGKAGYQGGTGTTTVDTDLQVDAALAKWEYIKSAFPSIEKVYGVIGTPYHTAVGGQKMEIDLYEKMGAKMYDQRIFPRIHGKKFDIRHYCPASTIPESRPRIIAQQWMRARDWWMEDGQHLPDVLIRGHVHYVSEALTRSKYGEHTSFTCAGLQGVGSDYGAGRCDGVIHFGMTLLVVPREGRVRCHHRFGPLR